MVCCLVTGLASTSIALRHDPRLSSIGLSGSEGIQRRVGPRAPACELSSEGLTVGTGQFPQGRLVASYEAGIPSRLDILERPQEQGAPAVAELFRGVRGRSANHGSPPVHRGPEPAFGRCALSPGPEGPGTSRLLIGNFSEIYASRTGPAAVWKASAFALWMAAAGLLTGRFSRAGNRPALRLCQDVSEIGILSIAVAWCEAYRSDPSAASVTSAWRRRARLKGRHR
jgi:hypothetical protein